MTTEQIKLHEEICKTFELLKAENAKVRERADALSLETRDNVNKAITDMQEQIKAIQNRDKLPGAKADNSDTDTEKELQIRAFEKYIRHGKSENARTVWTEPEVRALSSLSDGAGGFLVPPQMESNIIMKAYNMEEVRPYCNVGTTGRDVVYLPSMSKPAVTWGTTMLAVSDQTITAGQEKIHIYDLRALVKIHNNTLDDSEANIESTLTEAFGRATAEAEDTAFTTGASENTPRGFASDSRVQAIYTASGVAAVLTDSTHDGVTALLACMYKPKKIYRKTAVWMCNSTTEAVLRTLNFDQLNYLWQPPKTAGAPPTLLGHSLINPEAMADIGAGAFPIIFADMYAGYQIRDRAGLSVTRQTELYSATDETGIMIKKRVGGAVVLAEAFSCIKIATS